ncbi:MAG TPA: hypothetical protein ENF73_04185, partial [Proteobacteria bacterium]|nr:hypothetical protein [Pseudomonadota bacterium]
FSDLFVRPDAKPPDVLCFCGGDGTVHHMLTHLLEKVVPDRLPPLCFLPGGSMNTVMGTLGVKGNPVDLLTRAYRLMQEGGFPRVEVRRPLIINEKAGFLFGAGSAMVMLEEYYSMPGETGPRKAAELAYRSIASVITRGQLYKRFKEPIRVSVIVDGRRLPHERYRMVLAGTVEEIGLGFKLLYRAPEDRTKFHLIASLIKPMKFLRQIRRMYVGLPLRGRGHYDMMASEAEIVPSERLRYFIDGELFETEVPLAIRVGPPLRLLVP